MRARTSKVTEVQDAPRARGEPSTVAKVNDDGVPDRGGGPSFEEAIEEVAGILAQSDKRSTMPPFETTLSDIYLLFHTLERR